MVSVFDFGACGPDSSPDRVRCAVFLGKTPDSHRVSLYEGEEMSTGVASHPGGSINTPSHFMPLTPSHFNAGLMSHLALLKKKGKGKYNV